VIGAAPKRVQTQVQAIASNKIFSKYEVDLQGIVDTKLKFILLCRIVN
jgi:hypothetical protein